MRLLALALLLVLPIAAQDWPKIETETLEHFINLIRLDTSNPPGNETLVAEYLKKVLDKEGIETKLLVLESDRANLLARIKGNGSKRPILILGHSDVVGVQKEKWTVDPFAGVRKGGYIYGRGALDDKDNVAACLMTMILLKRLNVPLDRDVIFLSESGEEGFNIAGLAHVLAKHFPEIDAEFALAEGGGGVMRKGEPLRINIQTTEKVSRGVTLVARGTAGHGSVPRPDNALAHLGAAVGKIAAWMPPMKLNDTTRSYFERLATVSSPEARARYNALFDTEKRAAAEQYLARNELRHNSMLRTSISPTMISGGFRVNVIPSEAEATLDIRAVPDEDMDKFVEMMKHVINDPQIELKRRAGNRPPAPPSGLKTEMFAVLERVQKRMYPNAITLPTMSTGATDLTPLRARGIQAYGVGSMIEESDESSGGGMHGDDERVTEAALHSFVQYFYNVVSEIASTRK